MGVRRLGSTRTWVGLLATVLAASLVACSGGNDESVAEPPAAAPDVTLPTVVVDAADAMAVTESTPRSSTAAPDGSSPPDLPNGVIANDAAMLLSLLPSESGGFWYANVEAMLQRQTYADYLPGLIEDTYYWSNDWIEDNFLSNASVQGYVSGQGLEDHSNISIFLGNFEDYQKELRGKQNPPAGITRDGPAVPVSPYRGVEVFYLSSHLEGDKGPYAAVIDTIALLLGTDEASLYATIDRLMDGGQMGPAMAGLFNQVERMDILSAYAPSPEMASQSDDPTAPVYTFHAYAGFLSQGETTTLYAYVEFLEEFHAEQVIGMYSEEPDVDVFFRRYNSQTARPQGEFWQDGRAIVARAVVPDDDVDDLISSN